MSRPPLRVLAFASCLLLGALPACGGTDGDPDAAPPLAERAGAAGAAGGAGASAGKAGAAGGGGTAAGAGGGSGGKAAAAGSSGAAGAGAGGKGGAVGAAGAGGAGAGGGAGAAGAGGGAGASGAGASGGKAGAGGAGAAGAGGAPPAKARIVAYLPNYSGSYADWAKKIDFTKMTHLNLAFALANADNGWDMGASDAEVKALVDAAHAHGTKVLASLGGGGGDQTVIARYKNPANIGPLVDNLDAFVTKHGLDGADVDIEDGSQLGKSYTAFIAQTIGKLRPKGKLVTAAVAQYLQGGMSDETLHSFDFVNVMIYSSYDESVKQMQFYSQTKGVPKDRMTLGAGFFGSDGSMEYAYRDILAADGSAWSKDQAKVNGKTVSYTGVASMKKLADYAKGFGGIMFWELSEDAPGEHSLYKVIQDAN